MRNFRTLTLHPLRLSALAPLLLTATVQCGSPQSAKLGSVPDPNVGAIVPDASPQTIHSAGGAQIAGPQVLFEVAVMSKCPYAARAIPAVQAMATALAPNVQVVVDYIGAQDNSGHLTSMHGESEVLADIAQLCVQQVAPSRLLDVMACQTREDYAKAEQTWQECASEAGVPVGSVASCMKSGEGERLLAASFARTRERGISGSPTFHIGGKQYSGDRRESSLIRAVCAELPSQSAACDAIAPLVPVNVIVLGDRRCADCATDRYASMLQNYIGRPIIRVVDYMEPEGKQLYQALPSVRLPVVAFDSSLNADQEALASLGSRLKEAGAYRYMTVGGKWNPVCSTPEGCKKAECKDELNCHTETPRRVDLYIMSHCPFAVRALNSMETVFKDLGPTLDFRVHYIGDVDAKGGLSSMHGPDEVEEDLREVCAIKYYAQDRKFMRYIACRNRDLRGTDWVACTGKDTGIDAGVIRRCSTGKEGQRLLLESFQSTKVLSIGASPTWVVNNRYTHSGITPEAIEGFICQHNPKLKGCDRVKEPAAHEPRPGAGVSGECD